MQKLHYALLLFLISCTNPVCGTELPETLFPVTKKISQYARETIQNLQNSEAFKIEPRTLNDNAYFNQEIEMQMEEMNKQNEKLNEGSDPKYITYTTPTKNQKNDLQQKPSLFSQISNFFSPKKTSPQNKKIQNIGSVFDLHKSCNLLSFNQKKKDSSEEDIPQIQFADDDHVNQFQDSLLPKSGIYIDPIDPQQTITITACVPMTELNNVIQQNTRRSEDTTKQKDAKELEGKQKKQAFQEKNQSETMELQDINTQFLNRKSVNGFTFDSNKYRYIFSNKNFVLYVIPEVAKKKNSFGDKTFNQISQEDFKTWLKDFYNPFVKKDQKNESLETQTNKDQAFLTKKFLGVDKTRPDAFEVFFEKIWESFEKDIPLQGITYLIALKSKIQTIRFGFINNFCGHFAKKSSEIQKFFTDILDSNLKGYHSSNQNAVRNLARPFQEAVNIQNQGKNLNLNCAVVSDESCQYHHDQNQQYLQTSDQKAKELQRSDQKPTELDQLLFAQNYLTNDHRNNDSDNFNDFKILTNKTIEFLILSCLNLEMKQNTLTIQNSNQDLDIKKLRIDFNKHKEEIKKMKEFGITEINTLDQKIKSQQDESQSIIQYIDSKILDFNTTMFNQFSQMNNRIVKLDSNYLDTQKSLNQMQIASQKPDTELKKVVDFLNRMQNQFNKQQAECFDSLRLLTGLYTSLQNSIQQIQTDHHAALQEQEKKDLKNQQQDQKTQQTIQDMQLQIDLFPQKMAELQEQSKAENNNQNQIMLALSEELNRKLAQQSQEYQNDKEAMNLLNKQQSTNLKKAQKEIAQFKNKIKDMVLQKDQQNTDHLRSLDLLSKQKTGTEVLSMGFYLYFFNLSAQQIHLLQNDIRFYTVWHELERLMIARLVV